MILKQDLLDTAAERAKSAAELGTATWNEAKEKLVPLLETAASKVGPLADEAVHSAIQAKRRAAGLAADAVEHVQPTVNAALDKVSPAVDRAQKVVQDDLLPKLIEVLHKAATGRDSGAILASLDERAEASMKALKTEVVQVRKYSKAKTVITIAAVGAVLGALAVAVRTFLGSREDWAAYEPDEPYVYPDDDYEIDEVVVDEEPPAEAEAPAEPVVQPYGEGSYVGATPPEGFTIKGNERSMKYHVPDSAGYARTTGDVWFASEEAAQAAGFVRSQR